ncbi:Pilus assembly protein [Methylorubrum thiocyanatum]|uniref:Flp family type IVb pilin n=1 Tax=Methylorubrum thiocyanatum TaxID=47958 RepID=UPI00398C6E46
MKNVTKRFISDESGATAIEYGMVAAMMGIAVVAIFTAFKTKLTTAFETLAGKIDTQTTKIQ